MKKTFLLLSFLCCGHVLFAQTLFTYGDAAVDKEEFLRAYNKNKTPETDREKALREYLDLYIKFKLKVKAAKEMRLDTLPQLQTDLENFRAQVEDTYMNNEESVNALMNEAFARSQKDVHVLHFFVEINSTAPTDTAGIYKGMAELQRALNAGGPYEQIVQDISRKNGIDIKPSDIGFVTAFSVPYEYENVIYKLKTGEASAPYRSKRGLHIFKVVEERKAAGRWRIAQILIAYPPGDAATTKMMVSKKADSIYNVLLRGADFATMAGAVSDDKLTYMTGGEMPEFGAGKFDPSFESQIFKLKEGEMSKPFASAYGYHIVKVLKQTPVPADKNDLSFQYDLKQKLTQDSRIGISKEKFNKQIIGEVGYKRNVAIREADLYRFADSVMAAPRGAALNKYPISDKTVLSFSKTNLKGIDWLTFVRDYKGNSELYQGEKNQALWDKFVSTSAQDYYRKHLEEFNPEFRHQMEEFKDGNVLFEIMERNVWGSAASDSAGLLKQYNDNKATYKWGPSAGVVIFNSNNRATADAAIAALKKGKYWKDIVAESNNTLQADSGRYEIAQLPLPAGITVAPGLITEPMANSADGANGFLQVIRMFDGNQQRTFNEARGLVINDYQNVLEERWVTDLKKKYPVKVNESVFQSLLK